MSTVFFIIQQTMFFFVPLLIVALGAMYSERSGVTNIGLEGIMIIGAFCGVFVIRFGENIIPGQFLFLAAILAAGVAGLLYSVFHAWASIRLQADQIISGTALNLFAPAFCMFLARNLFGNKQIQFADPFYIDKIPFLSDIPVIGPALFSKCYLSTFIGIAILPVLAWLLMKTPFGLRLRSCGENPEAAAGAGISVSKMRYTGVLMSGLLGGMGGIIFVVPTSTNFNSTVAGYGFLALSVLILGQWKPLGIFFASLFFGILKAVSSAYSGIPFLADLNIPSEIYKIVPYALTLVVLAASSKRSAAPKAVGKPYDDGTGFGGLIAGKRIKVRYIAPCAAVILIVFIILTGGIANGGGRGVSNGFGGEIALAMDYRASIDDKSFFQSEWDGIVGYTDKNGFTRKYYQAQDDSDEGLLRCLKLASKGNARLLVAGANQFQTAVYYFQDTYPDLPIILVDSVPISRTGEEKIGKRTVCLSFAEQQAGFLVGYAAVMDGYRSLGFIGGMAVDAVIRYGYGFAAGADYAAKELGLSKGDVSLKYNYSGAFAATPETLALAAAWYQDGTEVIFACGGTLGNSVMKAAEAAGKAVIGVDSDQSIESETVITSAMKLTGEGIVSIFDTMLDNPESIGGQSYVLTTKEGALGLPLETSRFRQFTEAQYNAIYEKLSSGSVSVPDQTAAPSAGKLALDIVTVKEIQ